MKPADSFLLATGATLAAATGAAFSGAGLGEDIPCKTGSSRLIASFWNLGITASSCAVVVNSIS